MPEYLNIALLSAPFSTLTYEVPAHLAAMGFPPGLRALVPLGKSIRAGVVMGKGDSPPEGVETRPLVWPLERAPLFDAAYLDMITNLASRQLLSPGRVLGQVLPVGLRQSGTGFSAPREGRIQRVTPRALFEMSGDEAGFWAGAWTSGSMVAGGSGCSVRVADRVLRLLVDPPWPVRPGAKARLALLDFLLERGQVPLGVVTGYFGRDMGPVIRALGKMGLVEIGAAHPDAEGLEPFPEAIAPCPPEVPGCLLTDEQAVALRELSKALGARSGQVRLVHGVTGSGKTRLYMELVRECLDQGRQAFLLAPEVALAGHLYRAVREAFPGGRVTLYHGSLSPSVREATFRRMAVDREPGVVVGTRSALFLPALNPGLFVLDEEHDASFKQEERLGYQAKEVAFFRARLAGALLVLGSATPDIKTYHSAMCGAVPAVTLTRRVGGGTPPDIEIVDMGKVVKSPSRRSDPEKGTSIGRMPILAEHSALALRETVERGEQAIILLNRRGYAPVLYCLDCEKVLACPDCDLAYTFHRGRQRLVCHYCGRTEEFPIPCASCGGSSFLPLGAGSESLEEELAGLLPLGTRVARLDRDSAARPGRAEEILADFASGGARVLAGTQMLSKGHHFPDVTLVIAADADMGRNLPDYRAAERTFQLLVQVAGRAGRGENPGRVFIQTRNPVDPFWDLVRRADYEGFYREELRRRERWLYPPFTKLGLVRVSFPKDCEDGYRILAEVGRVLRAGAATAGKEGREPRVLGPAPAALPLIGGRRRFHCLLKAPDWPAIRCLFAAAQGCVPRGGEVRMSLDLDPVDML